MTPGRAASPWRSALGARFDELAPSLRGYFDAIPPGHEGRGIGTFDVVGTPRRWLRPALAILGRAGIVFPVWERDVPFAIVNRPGPDLVRARREFRFRSGTRTMSDEIALTGRGLVDRLGSRSRIEVDLRADVVEGRLELRSRGARLRVGRAGIPVPAPRVTLVEEPEPPGRQRVSLTVDVPIVGRVYEYRGSFEYAVVESGRPQPGPESGAVEPGSAEHAAGTP